MRTVRNLLVAVIAIEIMITVAAAALHASRPAPPQVDLTRLDPVTAAALKEQRQQAVNGGSRQWQDLAESLLGNGYYVAAEQCFRWTADNDPENIHARYGQGFCLERVGRTGDAIAVLTGVAKRADENLRQTCWYQIARCHLREEDAEEAELAFRRISDFPPAAYQLAKILIRSDRAPEAMPILNRQLLEFPNSLKLLQLKMHAAEALEDSDLVAELRDREDRAEYQLILEYGQSFISMFAAQQGLAKMLSRAMRLKSQGTLRQRKAALASALEIIRPNKLWQYRSVLIASAHVELGLGNIAKATELADEIRQNTQDGIDVREIAALAAAAVGDHAAAYEHYVRIASMKPSADVYASLAETPHDIAPEIREQYRARQSLYAGIELYRRNDVKNAYRLFQDAADVLNTDPVALFYLGESLRISGETRAAAAAFQRCLEHNPGHGRARVKLQLLKGLNE